MTRGRLWTLRILAALGGALAMILLGQIFSSAGGRCAILCRPDVAAVYGSLVGLMVVGSGRHR